MVNPGAASLPGLWVVGPALVPCPARGRPPMKLSDTQTLLLAHAGSRDSGSLYPLPTTLTSVPGALKSITALVKRGLVEERTAHAADAVARADGNLRFGIYVTPAGLAAIGVDALEVTAAAPSPAPAPAAGAGGRTTKAAMVLALLQRDGGATLGQLVEATGWLPHTTRAALTGLRKKGHVIVKEKRDDATCYRITA